MEPYKGSVAHTYTALAPTSVLSGKSTDEDSTDASDSGAAAEGAEPEFRYARYASQADWLGREYVAAGRVDGWDEQDEGYSAAATAGAGAGAAAGGSEQGGEVRTLAREWRRQADAVLKKVRRDSDAGELPPGTKALREEMGRVLGAGAGAGAEGGSDEEREWEKVDQAV